MKPILKCVLFCTLLILTANAGHAVIEQVAFADAQTEQRYKKLIAEFRCLVCQNQNLADSDADLAKDLRRKTAQMLRANASDDDIRQYMRDRYGDFVSYRPPFNAGTALLWLGPFGLLIAVITGLILNIRRRQKDALLKPTHANNEAQRVKVQNLMRNASGLNNPPED